jgi:hypothetical protein
VKRAELLDLCMTCWWQALLQMLVWEILGKTGPGRISLPIAPVRKSNFSSLVRLPGAVPNGVHSAFSWKSSREA